MKTIRLAALAAAFTLGSAIAVPAQPPAGAPDRVGARQGARDRGGPGREGSGAMLRGITLTDAQKTRLREIRTRYAEQRRALGTELRPRNGTSARPDSAARIRARSLMERQAAEIRGVLTSEQQRTFDANSTTVRERLAKRQAKLAKHEAKSARRLAKGKKRAG